MMTMNNYHFIGMHLIWWFFWIFLLFWIFSPISIRGKRAKNGKPLDILKRRFASGEINQDEYLQKKTILDEKQV